jgi:hypothetical protein
MSVSASELQEFLVLSRGQWHRHLTPEQIQVAIDAFYEWHSKLVAEGRASTGSRLTRERKLVSAQGITDGPFSESKEIIGGYWFFFAKSLDEAAALAAQCPTLPCGLSLEVGPPDAEKARGDTPSNETPRG